MEIATFAVIIIISIAFPVLMMVGGVVFLWSAANRFPKQLKASVVSKVIAIFTATICCGYTLFGIYAVLKPLFSSDEGGTTNGIIILFGPTMFGFYSAFVAVVVGFLMFVVAKYFRPSEQKET